MCECVCVSACECECVWVGRMKERGEGLETVPLLLVL